MSLGAVGAVLAVLAIVFLAGRVWFAIVEGALGGLKRVFGKKSRPRGTRSQQNRRRPSMFDIDEIVRRAQEATDRASRQLEESMEKSREIAEKTAAEAAARQQEAEDRAAAQTAANQQRQVEILGELFRPEAMMDRLFGEDMGVLAAALETLAMEEGGGDEEDRGLDPALEQALYGILDEKLAQIDTLPEPEPVPYAKGDPRWARFGILLSGILSSLNDHQLDGMDVEAHIPVVEQQIVSLVRRSWGIHGRGELLDTIRYLTREGYALRYALYCGADAPEALLDEAEGEEEQASVLRGWRFAQHYKARFSPNFMTGWDVGRAAMLTRWGCYLGWITEGEAAGILWDLSQRAAAELDSWRSFAKSYLFGGLLWKLLCGDAGAESYLGFLADAATDLLTGKADEDEGQWRACPWPAGRTIGFRE